MTRSLVGVLALGLMAAPAAAQVEVTSSAVRLNFSGRVHLQFNTSSVDGANASEFLMRRARLTIDARLNDFVSGRIDPEFAPTSAKLRDAFVQLSFDPAFRVTAGQFKRPFDIFELTSSTQILVIERTGSIRDLAACPGVGTCSYSGFTEALQLSDRDVGVQIDGRMGRAHYAAAVTNGRGQNAADENSLKSFSGRVTVDATSNVRIAANVGIHDFPNTVTVDDDYAVAVGGDVEIGNFNQGLHVQAGATGGENWQNLSTAGEPSTFLTVQGIVTYKRPVRANRFVQAVEPVARLSWGDPDADAADDAQLLVTPGLIVHFVSRARIMANVDIIAPQSGDTEFSLKLQTNLYF